MDDKEKFDHSKGWQSTQVAQNYDQRRFNSLTGRLYDFTEKRAIAALLSHANSRAPVNSILDIPAGTGRISKWLLDQGYLVECADISREMLEVALQRMEGHPGARGFNVLDIYNISRPDNHYDCVTCIRLFQHLQSEQRAAALSELARITKRFVIVNVMYTSAYYAAIRSIRKAIGRYAPRYTTSKSELENETGKAHLRIAASRFTQPGYNGNLVLLLEKE